MSINFKKILLTGTALVAVAFIPAQAHAAALAALAAPGTWASSGVPGSTTVADAAAADTLAGSTFLLTITNDGTANDGSGLNTFAPGALTGTTGGVTITTGSANDLTVSGVSAVYSGAAPIIVTNRDADNAAVAASFSGNVSTAGAGTLAVTNVETSVAKAVTLTVGGTTSIGGTTTVTAGAFAGASSNIVNTGAATYTGAVTLNAGAGAGSDATITLNGAGVNAFTGGLVLNDGTAGLAKLTLSSGGGAQTVNGTIDGAAAGEGTLISNKAAAGVVTFSGAVGTTALKTVTLSGVSGTTFSSTLGATTLNLNNAAGTNTFTGAVTATNIAFGAASNATFDGGVTSSSGLNFGAHNGTVTLGGGSNFTGTIDAGAAGTGTLTLSGASTLSSTVGATNSLLAINAGAGAVVFTTGAVKATTITMNGASTVAFNGTGDVTATTLAYGANNATVTFASGRSLVGAVTATNTGTLTFAGGTQSVSGNIGTLTALNAGATGGTTTFSGTVAATTVNVTGNGSVNLNGNVTGSLLFGSATGTATLANTKTLSGTIDGTGGVVGTGIGNLVYAGSSATAASTIGATGILRSLTLSGTAATVTTTGAILAADTTTLGSNTLASGAAFGLGAAQTLAVTIVDGTTYGHVTAVGNATTATTSLVNITMDTSVYLPTTSFTLVDGAAGAGVGVLAAGKLTVNGVNSGAGQTVTAGLMTFSQAVNTQDLVITATRAAATTVGDTANNDSIGAALDTIGTGGTAVVDALQGELANAATAAAVNDVLESASPTVDGGTETAVLDMSFQTQEILDTRVASIRSDEGTTGMAAGASANGVSMWVQGFGQAANQDLRDGVAGYDSTAWGVAVGADTTNLSRGAVGLAFNYGRTSVDSNNVNTTETDIDSYGLTVYGNYDLGEQRFLNGQIGYAYNDIESDRHNVGFAGVIAHGETNSDQYSARAVLGSDYNADFGTILTPTLSAAYTHLTTEGYTETGSGANLTVDSSDIDVLSLGVGLKAAWKLKYAEPLTGYGGPHDTVVKPSLRVGYSYDVLSDRVETTSSFVGAPGTTFATNGADPDRNRFNAGAGIAYITSADWDLSANYDYTYKADYQAHAGVMRMTSHF